jgi:hypothetical protein
LPTHVVPDEEGKFPFEEESMPHELFLFLSIGAICVFTFVSIAVASESKRKEREAYYKSESFRRIAEMPATSSAGVLEVMREEQRMKLRNRNEGMKIGGLINIAVGLGLVIFLYSLGGKDSPYLCGLIPAFIGIAMLVYVLLLAPKEA